MNQDNYNQDYEQHYMQGYIHPTHRPPQDIQDDGISHPATSHHGMPATPQDAPMNHSGRPKQEHQEHHHAPSSLTDKLEAKAQEFESRAGRKIQQAKERMQEQQSQGKQNQNPYSIAVDEAVVEKIAARTVRRIPGIVALKGGPLCTIQENLGTCPTPKGTKAVIHNDEVCIEVAVILKYGTPAKDVFEAVKHDVIPEVESLTGLKAKELTVRIVSVMDEDEISQMKNKPTAMETAENVAGNVGSALSSMAGVVVSTVKTARQEAVKAQGRSH